MADWADLLQCIEEGIIVENDFGLVSNEEHLIEDIEEVDDMSYLNCSCGGRLTLEDNITLCTSCGLEKQNYMTEEATNKQCCSNTIKIVSSGTNKSAVASMQRNMTIATSNYNETQKYNTTTNLLNMLKDKTNVPLFIIQQTVAMYNEIRSTGNVYRKNVKLGIIAACISINCTKNNISRTPIEICTHLNIKERFYLCGLRILNGLNERNEIDIETKLDPTIGYVKRYLEILNIDARYEGFVIDMINRCTEKKIHIINSSKECTKAIGSIYALTLGVKELNISDDEISSKCSISKTTFIKYYKVINDYFRLFVVIYAKHKITMPKHWREDINLNIKHSINKNKTSKLERQALMFKSYEKIRIEKIKNSQACITLDLS